MGKHSHNKTLDGGIDRVDGMAKVTGTAKYSAEYDLQGLCYAVLVGSTIAKGTITAMDTGGAERAPGVLSVITHLNVPVLPGTMQSSL